MNISFILIDDSELDCFIAKKIIEQTIKPSSIKVFRNAKPALETIREKTADIGQIVVILLDLHMPLMSGFQFVEEFEKLPVEIQEKYKIIILSSTRNKNDIFRVLYYKNVSHFQEKPLTRENLLTMVDSLKKDVS